ncbi:hypothetical protein AHMF7605_11875 [Adhaeribacter arboris]|uniref:Phage portal protein n=1 Tax=Adhaeribacter arboris TaxID=2072846 RepID=A0A2T2YF82_9BACT|nr:phage portal protein [Adhaeribacter arboris]PSR54170.1 hypothetical protein AHMF7605_11875 [Adhaeribacter arboris]
MTPEKFQELLEAKNIDSLRSGFVTREKVVEDSLKQYQIAEHQVMKRQDKIIKKADGATENVKQWKLPVPYQKKIVELAVAFLFGKPVQLVQQSEGTDEVFGYLTDLWKDMRQNARNRELARTLFSETEVARLFFPQTEDPLTDENKSKPGVVKVRSMLLAKSLGDTLYTLFDSYGALQAFGRGYLVMEGEKEVEHFDVYQAKNIIYCTKKDDGWEVETKANPIGKIPASYYKQAQTEWADVQPLIERYEYLGSRRADVNDYSADPILILKGIVQSLPGKDEVGRVVELDGPGADASYLTPQMAVEMVKQERENLKEDIQFFTDTPDISLEKMATIGTTSGKAMELLFFQALLKAMRKHELFEEMIDREINIIKAFITTFVDTNPTIAQQAKNLKVGIEFGNPLPDSFEDVLNMLNLATGGKAIMSQKTAVSQNPLVKDADTEYSQLQGEETEDKVTLTI